MVAGLATIGQLTLPYLFRPAFLRRFPSLFLGPNTSPRFAPFLTFWFLAVQFLIVASQM